ncbi:MAG TPA: flagellin [Phycisphaerae bacterium]|nr:flagellin [Phycisphaerae bacterium]
MFTIRNNLMAETAGRLVARNYATLATSVERLASGLRINSARDDPVGLAVRELLRADVVMYQQASRNALDGVSMLQVAEGALSEIDEVLIRMKSLAEQASNDTYSAAQRTVMDEEFNELAAEVTRIAESSNYNGKEQLSGVGTTVNIYLINGSIAISSDDMTADGLNIESTEAVTEVWTHSYYKTSADEIYIPDSDISQATADIFSFEFSVDSGAIVTDLDTYKNTGITLNELITEINTVAGYTAATAEYDVGYNAYRLGLTAENAGDTTMTWGGGEPNSHAGR